VRGVDGRYDDYDPAHEQFAQVEVNEQWIRFADPGVRSDGDPASPPQPA
jgi:hypothetical protein